MDARLTPIRQSTVGSIHLQAARSIFWELEPGIAPRVAEAGNGPFEKEAWLSTTLLKFGTCGFNIGFPRPEVPRRAHATILYCGKDDAPGAVRLPTAPVSDDAEIITSLFIDPGFENSGIEAVLLDAAIMELVQKDASAVEAFGWRRESGDPLPFPDRPEDIGLIDEPALTSAGFEVVSDHPVLPKLRLELPPAQGLLSAAAVEKLLSGAEASVAG